MELREMQQTATELRKKAIQQSIDRKILKRYENAGDKVNAERIRGIMAERQKKIETLRKTINNQRRSNGISCRWLSTSQILEVKKHDEQ